MWLDHIDATVSLKRMPGNTAEAAKAFMEPVKLALEEVGR